MENKDNIISMHTPSCICCLGNNSISFIICDCGIKWVRYNKKEQQVKDPQVQKEKNNLRYDGWI